MPKPKIQQHKGRAAEEVVKEKPSTPRKRPYRSADLLALQDKLLKYAGKFQSLAIELDEESIDVVVVDGGAMLDRAFDQMDLFLANGQTALIFAKAQARRSAGQ